jgi:hypothetical protein
MEVSGQLRSSAALLPQKEPPAGDWVAPEPVWTRCRGDKIPGRHVFMIPKDQAY